MSVVSPFALAPEDFWARGLRWGWIHGKGVEGRRPVGTSTSVRFLSSDARATCVPQGCKRKLRGLFYGVFLCQKPCLVYMREDIFLLIAIFWPQSLPDNDLRLQFPSLVIFSVQGEWQNLVQINSWFAAKELYIHSIEDKWEVMQGWECERAGVGGRRRR